MLVYRFGVLQILVVLVMGCANGFSTVPPTDTAATNAVRRKIGIREIKPGWVFYGREFSEERWMESGTELGAATGECKRVHRDDDDGIEWEEDHFLGARTFVDAKGVTIRESFTVHYDYLSGKFSVTYFGKDPGILALTSGLHATPAGSIGADNAETLAVADKILAGWKLKRL